jgi:hypothetical protein
MFRTLAGALAATLLSAAVAQAAVVTVGSNTLASNAGVYSDLVVSTANGGTLTTIGAGAYEGLWFGSNHQSGDYTFTFSQQLDYFSVLINAMSTTNGGHAETLGAWTVNAPGAPTFGFTNVQFTAWDGATVTSGPVDDGTFLLTITPLAGQTFNTISFHHQQTGSPSGSVIRQVQYQVASDAGAIPEPVTWSMMLLGFLGTGVALRRRRTASATPWSAIASY